MARTSRILIDIILQSLFHFAPALFALPCISCYVPCPLGAHWGPRFGVFSGGGSGMVTTEAKVSTVRHSWFVFLCLGFCAVFPLFSGPSICLLLGHQSKGD